MRIDKVKYRVGILLVAGCKCYHLILFIGFSEALVQMCPDVDASVSIISLVIKWDSNDDIWNFVIRVALIEAVYHGFINVQDE